MTELSLLVAFILNLPVERRYKGHHLDVKFLNSIHEYLIRTGDDSYFANVISGLCQMDDAIVTGLSEGRFRFTHPSFAVYRQSDLPRFLYGLLSLVFHDDGTLRALYDANSVEICLQALRLVRRAKSKSFTAIAEKTAVDKFISYQDRERPGVQSTMLEIADLWAELEGESFLESVKLGKPGNGVCNDMRFPYVPDLAFPDIEDTNEKRFPHNVERLLTKARDDQFAAAGFTRGKHGWVIPNLDFVGFYYPTDHEVAKLAIVPKKYNEGRAITTTTVFATILGATLRESIFNRVRELGAISMLNVHDQTLSHSVLRDHFDTVACLDLEGGSSCFTTNNLDLMLSKTTYIGDCWKSSRPSSFSYQGVTYPLRTLTMGDASSVSLLTGTLFLALVLAYKRYHHLDGYYLTQVIKLMLSDGRFRVVGDDIICPDYLLEVVKQILEELAVTINTRKSSDAKSAHKESCGAWFIRDYVNRSGIRRIYPFRAAVPDRIDYLSVTSTVEQYLDKIQHSELAYTAYKAHITVLLPLDERIKYDQLKSFSPAIVGTRFGRHWSTTYRSCKQDQQFPIDDALAYICGIRDSLVTPRFSRVTKPPRLRQRKKCLDLSYRSSLASHLRTIAIAHIFGPSAYKAVCPKYSSAPVPDYKYIAWNNPAITSPGQRVRRSSLLT